MKLHEAGVSLIDCDHRTPPAAEAGFPYIAIPQLKAGRLDLSEARRISPENFAEWTRKANPQADDVVLSRRCNPGKTAVVPEGLECALGQNLVLLRADGKTVLPKFLRWAVRGPAWWDQVGKFINVGAVFDSLRCGDVPSFELPIPPLAQQEAIVGILGTLDEKIELNRRMNETLEAMARALFKSWFVDFDPVRARAQGRKPAGLDPDTAKLFPKDFVDSDPGEIPKGWTCAPLAHWASALSGGTPSKGNAALWNGDLPWISPKVMTSIHADETDAFVTRDAVGNGTRIAPAGCTLIMVRGMGLHQEVRVSQARREVTFNQDVKALVPRQIEANLLLFAMLDAQEVLLGRVESSGHGTGKLPSEILLRYPIAMPPSEVQGQLAGVFTNMNDRIAATRNETRNLAELRDHLLPRLLSGELPVTAARRVLEARA
jgi:type I restriction enzyme, S subunit